MTGNVAKIVEGSKNQNKPTPKVNMTGKTKAKRVAFLPKDSLRDHTNITRVNKLNTEIPTYRY